MKIRNVFFFVLILLVFAGCGKKENNEFKIGAILPLTGDAAFVGVPIKEGIELRLKEYNDTSKLKIRLVYEDSQANPTSAINSFNKLSSEGIKIIIGPASSSEALSLVTFANRDHILLFSPSASSPLLTNSLPYF